MTTALSFLATLAAARGALAATYQVGATKPYANLQAVAPLLAPGDVVELDGDATYPGDVLFTKWGSSSQKITIKGIRINGKRPVISGGVNTIQVYANHYVFEALDLTGGTSRCFFHHGDDITLRDSVVHHCPGHGVFGADSESGSLTMEYVEVYSSGAGDTKHPVYIATDEETYPGSVFRMRHCYVHDGNGGNNVKTRAERNEIYYNWIEGALYHELELIGPDGQDPALAREDSDVVGNVFRKTGTSFVTRIGGDGTGDTNGRYRFVNNTFLLAQGSASAFRLFDGVESVEMHNNVFFRVGGGGVKLIQDADVSWATGSAVIAGSNNWVATASEAIPSQWTGTITGADPTFANLVGDDLVPLAPSQLVDSGVGSTASPAGFAFPAPLAMPAYLPPQGAIQALGGAAARPVAGAIDIGAFELGSSGGGSSSASSSSASSSSASSSASSSSAGGGGESSTAATTGAGGAPNGGSTGGAGAGEAGSGASGGSTGDGGGETDPGTGSGDGAGASGSVDRPGGGTDDGAGGDVFLGDENNADASEAESNAGMSGGCRASRGGATGSAAVIMAFAGALAIARRSRRRAAAR